MAGSKYDAFISYSHGTDARMAEELQRGLRRFAKPLFRRQALNVFRDSTGLSANPGLWTSIREAMDDSEHLVLLCSPESAASPWVGREINHWIDTKPGARILPVLTDGELVWDDATGQFDPARSTAAHPALADAFTEEPLYVDLRWARTEAQLSLANPGFRDQVADLAAPLHGRPKDEMIGEDIRQHRRTLRYTWGAAVALALLTVATVVGAVIAVDNANEAKETAEANVKLEGDLAAKLKLLDEADADLKQANAGVKAAEKAKDAADAAAEEADRLAEEANTAKTAAEAAQRTAEGAASTARSDANRQRGLAAVAETLRANADVARGAAEAAKTRADVLAAEASALAASAQQAAVDAGNRATRAQALADAADKAAVEAKGREAAAIVLQKEAEGLRDKANIDRDAAVTQRNRAQAVSRSTTLGVEAGRAADSNLDLALLLANEASQVGPAAAVTASAVDDSEDGPTVGPLLDSLSEAGNVEGFFHFAPGTKPQQIGEVAVSPDGSSVIAAETSTDIRLHGSANGGARLYAWVTNGADPTRRTSALLGSDLGCVSDIRWLTGGLMVTIEELNGCFTPDVVAKDAANIPYSLSRLRLWNPVTGEIVVETSLVVSAGAGSPISISPDGSWLAFGVMTESRPPAGQFISHVPIQNTVLVNPSTGAVGDFENAVPQSLFGSSFSPSGRYFTVDRILEFDDDILTALQVIDLQTFSGSFLQAPRPLQDFGYAQAVWPSNPGVEQTVAMAMHAPYSPSLRFFDPTTGLEMEGRRRCSNAAQCGGTATIPGPIGAIEFTDTRAFLLSGTTLYKFDPRPAAQAQPLVALTTTPSSSACTTIGVDLRNGGDLLFIEESCGVAPDLLRSTRVIDLRFPNPVERGTLTGQYVHVSPDSRFVITRDLDLSKGVTFQSRLWELPPLGGSRLIDAQAGEPVASRDGYVVAIHRPLFTNLTPAPVNVWRLRPGVLGAETMGGSVGTAAVGFGPGDDLVGFGSGSAVRWGLDDAFHQLDYRLDVPASNLCAATDALRNVLRSAGDADGGYAVATDAKSIRLVPPGLGGLEITVPPLGLGASERIGSLRFAKDGRSLLVNIESTDRNCNPGTSLGAFVVQVRDAAGNRLVSPTVSNRLGEIGLSSSEDGSRIMFRNIADDELIVRDARTLAELGRVSTSSLQAAKGLATYAIDATGARLGATNSAGRVLVWSVAPEAVLHDLSSGAVQPTADLNVSGLAFSPDGASLAVRTVDQRLEIFDLPSERIVRSRQVPLDAVGRVTYSADGALIAVDGTYVFAADTLRQLGPRLRPAAWDDIALDIGTLSTRFVAGADGATYLVVERTDNSSAARWRVDAAGLRQQACDRAGRNLSSAEAALYGVAVAPHRTCSEYAAGS